jgi:hypothetical protein
MPKKSSIMAKIGDTLTVLTGYVKDAQEEMTGYMEDAEKYRELKPVLNKLAARTADKPATEEQPPLEDPPKAKPGDLCPKCEYDKNCSIGHDAAEACGGFSPIDDKGKKSGKKGRNKDVPPNEPT